MTVERMLRGMAGVMVLLSISLAYFVDPRWLLLTALVGLNLLQSAVTNWCPAMILFKKMGMKGCCHNHKECKE